MRKSREMQKVITKLAKARKLDLTKMETHFTAKSGGFMDLVVEVIAPRQVSVAHYYKQSGDSIQDPEIVFWIGADDEWYAIEITTPMLAFANGRMVGGYNRLMEFDDSGQIDRYKPRAQKNAAVFANKWAKNIRMQGFE